jgi:hypothetical protein
MKKNTYPFFFKEEFSCAITDNLKMNLSAIFIFLSILCVFPNSGYSQKKITFDLKDVNIKEVLNEIKAQTGYKFLYRSSEINVIQKASMAVNNKTTTEILDRLFKNRKSNCTYQEAFRFNKFLIKVKTRVNRYYCGY